jgi:hypothetical protein
MSAVEPAYQDFGASGRALTHSAAHPLLAMPPPVWEREDWQADLAAAFVLGGFWRPRQREDERRRDWPLTGETLGPS